MTNSKHKHDALVFLIHGIACPTFALYPFAYQLRRRGFDTACFGYPSLLYSVEHHAANFRKFIEQRTSEGQSIYIVAHSLGGIITRCAFGESCPEYVKKIVLLTTPNQGSPQARFLSRFGLGFIKTLKQLSAGEGEFIDGLPRIEGPEILSISASYDWVVPKTSSSIEWETEHKRIFSGHNGVLVRPKVARVVAEFLSRQSNSTDP